jgi:hypothetical protein
MGYGALLEGTTTAEDGDSTLKEGAGATGASEEGAGATGASEEGAGATGALEDGITGAAVEEAAAAVLEGAPYPLPIDGTTGAADDSPAGTAGEADDLGASAPPPGVTVMVTFSEAVTVTVAGPHWLAPPVVTFSTTASPVPATGDGLTRTVE